MNPLYEPLPEKVKVDGESYGIVTDFREWIKFVDMFEDTEITPQEKALAGMCWYTDDYPGNTKNAMSALVDFLLLKGLQEEHPETAESTMPGQNRTISARKAPVFSYREDAAYVISGFQECYGIDLLSVDYIHWWRFNMLFQGLSEETEIMKRIGYRSIDLNSIKNKKERDRIRKIQSRIALHREVMSDYDIGNAFI